MAERDKEASLQKLKDTSAKMHDASQKFKTDSSDKGSSGIAGTRGYGGTGGPPTIHAKEEQNMLASTISNFHANLVRPGTSTGSSSSTTKQSFSAKSSAVAKQFLHEGDHDEQRQQGGGGRNDLEHQAASAGSATAGLSQMLEENDERASLFQQDMSEYSEAMSQQNEYSQRGTNSGGSNQGSGSDLEWNPEAQRQQQEEWRNRARDVIGHANAVAGRTDPAIHRAGAGSSAASGTGASSNLFARPDSREVDQTINLMDSSMGAGGGDYDNLMPSYYANNNTNMASGAGRSVYSSGGASNHSKQSNNKKSSSNSGGTSNSFFGQMNSSLVDIWLDERSSDTMTSKQRMRRRRVKGSGRSTSSYYRDQMGSRNCCRDLFCSWLTLLLLMGGLLGAFIAWRTGAFVSSSSTTPAADVDVDIDIDTADTTPPALPDTTNLDDFQAYLVEHEISSIEDLETENSPQYLAWHWVTTLEDPTLLLDNPAMQAGKQNEFLNESKLEAYGLAVLYFSTNGYLTYNLTSVPAESTIWRDNTNWMRPVPVCHWFGIDCEEDHRVVHINLSRNNLKGKLPQELKVLSDLRLIDFSRNGFTGQMPDALFAGLPLLSFFYLQQNQITGTLPTSIGSMVNLESFQLFKNEIEGTIPAQMDSWTMVKTVALQENKLTGTIPYLAKLSSIEFLHLQDNKLSKHVPFEIFRLRNMVELKIGKNMLTGTIPPEIESCPHLRIIELDSNDFSGALPNIFHDLPELKELHVQNNRFSGLIPESLHDLTGLERLVLDSNQFTGTIPVDFADMISLQEFRAYHNDLSGNFPNNMCALKESHELKFLAVDCDKVKDCDCCDECL